MTVKINPCLTLQARREKAHRKDTRRDVLLVCLAILLVAVVLIAAGVVH